MARDIIISAHSDSSKTSNWDLKIQAWISVMPPPRAAGNLRINGKEWRHMARKFLAQDCFSNLSAPVHFWHCPSSLQSLGDLMLSDQPECLWLTFAMALLALTLTGVLVLTWKLLGSSSLYSWKINFTGWRITLCSSSASNLCIDKFFLSSTVMKELCPFLCCPKWEQIVVAGQLQSLSTNFGHKSTGSGLFFGDLRSKICGDSVSLALSVSQEKWPDPSAVVLLWDVSPRDSTCISHYCEVHISLNANWMSI